MTFPLWAVALGILVVVVVFVLVWTVWILRGER